MLAGNDFFATSNWVYAIIIGTLAFILTQNGKFSFVVSAIAMMLFNGLVQIGSGAYNLHFGFDWTVIAILTAVVMFEVLSRVVRGPRGWRTTSKPAGWKKETNRLRRRYFAAGASGKGGASLM